MVNKCRNYYQQGEQINDHFFTVKSHDIEIYGQVRPPINRPLTFSVR
jgi:hypothetical protein